MPRPYWILSAQMARIGPSWRCSNSHWTTCSTAWQYFLPGAMKAFRRFFPGELLHPMGQIKRAGAGQGMLAGTLEQFARTLRTGLGSGGTKQATYPSGNTLWNISYPSCSISCTGHLPTRPVPGIVSSLDARRGNHPLLLRETRTRQAAG